MSTGAKVESLDALKTFRVALFKFGEAVNGALGDADADMQRTLMWLETEQLSHWQGQIRKRTEALAKALDALRQKTIFKDATGRVQSAVDEQKVVALCRRRLEVANQKLAAVKSAGRRLQKEIETYRGTTQRLATTVQSDLPVYAAKIDRMALTLQAYVELSPEDVSAAAAQAFSGERTRSAAEAAGYGAGVEASPVDVAAAATPGEPPGPPLEPSAFPTLRRQTPAEQFRLAAPPGLMPTANWKTRPLNNQQRDSLAAMQVIREPPDPADRIIVRREIEKSATIYLERTMARGQADSGWYVGPAVGVAPGLSDETLTDVSPPIAAMRVSDFLAVRPDLEHALSLPEGYLVVISPSEVLTVLDTQNRRVWTLKEMSARERPLGDERDGVIDDLSE